MGNALLQFNSSAPVHNSSHVMGLIERQPTLTQRANRRKKSSFGMDEVAASTPRSGAPPGEPSQDMGSPATGAASEQRSEHKTSFSGKMLSRTSASSSRSVAGSLKQSRKVLRGSTFKLDASRGRDMGRDGNDRVAKAMATALQDLGLDTSASAEVSGTHEAAPLHALKEHKGESGSGSDAQSPVLAQAAMPISSNSVLGDTAGARAGSVDSGVRPQVSVPTVARPGLSIHRRARPFGAAGAAASEATPSARSSIQAMARAFGAAGSAVSEAVGEAVADSFTMDRDAGAMTTAHSRRIAALHGISLK